VEAVKQRVNRGTPYVIAVYMRVNGETSRFQIVFDLRGIPIVIDRKDGAVVCQ